MPRCTSVGWSSTVARSRHGPCAGRFRVPGTCTTGVRHDPGRVRVPAGADRTSTGARDGGPARGRPGLQHDRHRASTTRRCTGRCSTAQPAARRPARHRPAGRSAARPCSSSTARTRRRPRGAQLLGDHVDLYGGPQRGRPVCGDQRLWAWDRSTCTGIRTARSSPGPPRPPPQPAAQRSSTGPIRRRRGRLVRHADRGDDQLVRQGLRAHSIVRGPGWLDDRPAHPAAQVVRRKPLHGGATGADGRSTGSDGARPGSRRVQRDVREPTYREFDPAIRAALAGDTGPLARLVAETFNRRRPYAGPVVAYSEGLDAAASCQDYPQLYDMTQPPAARATRVPRPSRAKEQTDPGIYAPFTFDEYLASGWEELDWCLQWPVASPPTRPDRPAAVRSLRRTCRSSSCPASSTRSRRRRRVRWWPRSSRAPVR